MRWIQALGNHDGLIQGNVHRNEALNQVAELTANDFQYAFASKGPGEAPTATSN
jgi:hypothetical protein